MKRMLDVLSSNSVNEQYRRNEDIGTIRTRLLYNLDGQEIETNRRSSNQIQVPADGEKASVKDMLRQISQ